MSEKRYELIERFIVYGSGKPQFTGYSLRVDGKEHDLKEVADRLNQQAETIERLSKPPILPRVSPEGLVEGEWYWCKRKGWTGMGFAKNDSWGNKLTGSVAIWIGDVDFSPESFSAIWGPIPEFELEGE